jgi:Uma2 family endonuclease
MATVPQTLPPKKLLTWREFALLPDPPDGSKQELVRGVIITMPPPRFRHGRLQGRAFKLLDDFVEPRKLGRVVLETGVITEHDPDSVRGPDVSYWSAERLPLDFEPELYAEVPADLVVEVLSPGETPKKILKKILKKIKEYFAARVRMVWLIDSEHQTVTVYRSLRKKTVYKEGDEVGGEDVLPGFSCPVAEFFK